MLQAGTLSLRRKSCLWELLSNHSISWPNFLATVGEFCNPPGEGEGKGRLSRSPADRAQGRSGSGRPAKETKSTAPWEVFTELQSLVGLAGVRAGEACSPVSFSRGCFSRRGMALSSQPGVAPSGCHPKVSCGLCPSWYQGSHRTPKARERFAKAKLRGSVLSTRRPGLILRVGRPDMADSEAQLAEPMRGSSCRASILKTNK